MKHKQINECGATQHVDSTPSYSYLCPHAIHIQTHMKHVSNLSIVYMILGVTKEDGSNLYTVLNHVWTIQNTTKRLFPMINKDSKYLC